MDSSLNHHADQTSYPDCLDISPERLNSMSPSKLEQAMEAALTAMSAENYDPAVIDAYLDALDQKAPMPEYPDARTSYADFQKKVQILSEDVEEQISSKHQPKRLRSVLRVSLVAALTAICLFGSMVAAQAAGVDVFKAIARWTDSVFSFGTLPDELTQDPASTSSSDAAAQSSLTDGTNVPEEYQEVQAELAERGLPLYFPKIPDGFVPQEPFLYINPVDSCISFTATYMNGDNCILFNMDQQVGRSTAIYEKDDGAVEEYVYHGVTHYIFSNTANVTAAWRIDDMEYSIILNSTSVDLTELIQSLYKE